MATITHGTTGLGPSRPRRNTISSNAFLYFFGLIPLACVPVAEVQADIWDKALDLGKEAIEKGEEAMEDDKEAIEKKGEEATEKARKALEKGEETLQEAKGALNGIGKETPGQPDAVAPVQLPANDAAGSKVDESDDGEQAAENSWLGGLQDLIKSPPSSGAEATTPAPGESGASMPSPQGEPDQSGGSPETVGLNFSSTQEGRFEIAGIVLGMTPEHVIATLRQLGFVPDDGGAGGRFVIENAPADDRAPISLSYLRGAQPQDPVKRAASITLPVEDGDTQSPYKMLEEEFGKPDICEAEHFCNWVRRFDGWTETLYWQGGGLHRQIKIAADVTDRASFARSAPAAPAASDDPAVELAFDPLAPYGVAVGMLYAEAIAALEANGYPPGNCTLSRKHGTTSEKVALYTTDPPNKRGGCGDGPVKMIDLVHNNSRGLNNSFDNVIAIISAELGNETDCTNSFGGLKCTWQSPPESPLVRQISLGLRPGYIHYQIEAVQGLE